MVERVYGGFILMQSSNGKENELSVSFKRIEEVWNRCRGTIIGA
jgi:hypothetical protein